jgi:CheY-like chemotaxis protein
MTIAELSRKTELALQDGKLTNDALRASLLELSAAFARPQVSSDPKPIVVDALSGRAIALVGFPTEAGDRLCAALERAGARPRVFETTVDAGARAVLDCHAMVYQVQEQTPASGVLAAAAAEAKMPLILAGKRDHILAVDLTVLAHTNDFLIDGWKPDEAVMRLSFALLRAVSPIHFRPSSLMKRAGERDAVLVADDDPAMLSNVRTALQDFGLSCTVILDGSTALERIRQDLPRVAVLDVNMPGLDGYLVLAAVRQEKLPVRVILLTSRKHENDISRAFTLGADDYIVKPFNRVELVARVRRLLKS